jgi:hypothetical protein
VHDFTATVDDNALIVFETTLQPAWYNLLTESKEWFHRPGMAYASLAYAGSFGRFKILFCMECSTVPFGIVTWICLHAFVVVLTGACSLM